jgi:hypothetical protein
MQYVALDAAVQPAATMRNLTYCVALVILPCTSEATFAADGDNGLRLAQRRCTSCHIVSIAPPEGTDGGPPLSKTLSFFRESPSLS